MLGGLCLYVCVCVCVYMFLFLCVFSCARVCACVRVRVCLSVIFVVGNEAAKLALESIRIDFLCMCVKI
jgi:hypothetical protein